MLSRLLALAKSEVLTDVASHCQLASPPQEFLSYLSSFYRRQFVLLHWSFFFFCIGDDGLSAENLFSASLIFGEISLPWVCVCVCAHASVRLL